MKEEQSHPTPLRWVLQKSTEEVFVIFAAGWVLLFVLESLKQGLVSHYLSLPHLAFGLLVLGVIMLSLQPEQNSVISEYDQKKQKALLAVLSLLSALSIIFITDLPPALTLLLIFVTVCALWAGSLSLQQPE